jgi:hypothetical protein
LEISFTYIEFHLRTILNDHVTIFYNHIFPIDIIQNAFALMPTACQMLFPNPVSIHRQTKPLMLNDVEEYLKGFPIAVKPGD